MLKIVKPGCSVDPLIQFVAKEWMSHVVWTLGENERLRFGALRRLLPGNISARTLSSRLKDLETHGYVVRHEHVGAVLKVEYSLTKAGWTLHDWLKETEKKIPLPI